MVIFKKSASGRLSSRQVPTECQKIEDIPHHFLRKTVPEFPQVSELDVVRHYTLLSQKNFSIDTHFYPLGSCTMKYNPKVCHQLSMLPGFLLRGTLIYGFDCTNIFQNI